MNFPLTVLASGSLSLTLFHNAVEVRSVLQNSQPLPGEKDLMFSLIELIYSSVGDPSLWPVVLERISEALHGEQTLFFSPLQQPGQPPALCSSGTAPEVLPLYVQHYHSVNPLNEPCDRMFQEGTVRYSHWALPDSEYERSEFYNDFFRPLRMHYSCGLKVPLACDSPAYLATQRAKDKGPFEIGEGNVLQSLMPHLQRALTLHVQFTQMRSAVLGLESALDAFDHAVFGLDRRGQVIFASNQAETLSSIGDGITIRNRRLCAIESGVNLQLQELLTYAIATGAGSGASPGGSMLIPRRSGKSDLRLTVTPFCSPVSGSSAQLAALIFVSDPAIRVPARGSILRTLYGLTPTEVRVANLLAEGMETKDIAMRLGLTLETGRFHVKRILAKTGARRQTQLLRLMLSLPGHA